MPTTHCFQLLQLTCPLSKVCILLPKAQVHPLVGRQYTAKVRHCWRFDPHRLIYSHFSRVFLPAPNGVCAAILCLYPRPPFRCWWDTLGHRLAISVCVGVSPPFVSCSLPAPFRWHRHGAEL
eukprot:EG_transcript_42446